MKVTETKLRKIEADEGKVLVLKEKRYDEEGNLIKDEGAKIIYLAISDSEDNYIEIDEENKIKGKEEINANIKN